jgi:hypothetical protein
MNHRGPWLGQIPLRMGLEINASSLSRHASTAPPPDAVPPEGEKGCIFIGGRTIITNATIDSRIENVKARGYKVFELDVPPPKEGEIVSGSRPWKYVWACNGLIPSPSPCPPGAKCIAPQLHTVEPTPPITPPASVQSVNYCAPGQVCPPTVAIQESAPSPQILPFAIGAGILGVIIIAALS